MNTPVIGRAAACTSSALRTALAAVAIAFAAPSSAAVVNGGFEAGDLSGWLTHGDTTYVGVDAGFARSGDHAAFFGPETPAGIEQAMSLAPKATYRVSFWLSLQDSAAPNAFSWAWNGVEQGRLDDATGFGYTLFSAEVASGPGGASSLSFEFLDPASFWLLDDVSVTRIPEPGVLALLAIAIAGLAAARRGGGLPART